MSDHQSAALESPGSLFRAGRLAAAVDAAGAAVRKAPSDIATRILLAELLLFTGNYERTDVLLDAAGQIDPEAVLVVAEFRQLLRAEMARRQFWCDGRVPDFLGEPTESQHLLLAASVSMRAGDVVEAGKFAAAAEAIRGHSCGSADKIAFDDFRDVNDLCAGTLEVLTTTGKYFWIPVGRVSSIDFHPPKRVRDLFWRRATMSVKDGPDGDIYLPVIYANEAVVVDDATRLGRTTAWVGDAGAPVRGIGQRTFLIGDDAFEIMSLKALEFDAAD